MNIMNLVDKIAADNKKLALVAIVSLAVFYFDFSMVLKPQLQSLKGVSAKVISTSNEITKLKQDLRASQDIKRKAEQQGMQSGKAKKIITDSEVLPFLKEISDLANKNQVRLNQIKPVKETKDTKETKGAKAGKFDIESISLDLTADYHKLGSFINDLENCNIFVWLEELRIVANPNDYFRQDAKLTLKTYVKK